MNRFAAEHPEDWEQRLDTLTDVWDLRDKTEVKKCSATHPDDVLWCDLPEGHLGPHRDSSTLPQTITWDDPSAA